jgi:hypothetical protein
MSATYDITLLRGHTLVDIRKSLICTHRWEKPRFWTFDINKKGVATNSYDITDYETIARRMLSFSHIPKDLIKLIEEYWDCYNYLHDNMGKRVGMYLKPNVTMIILKKVESKSYPVERFINDIDSKEQRLLRLQDSLNSNNHIATRIPSDEAIWTASWNVFFDNKYHQRNLFIIDGSVYITDEYFHGISAKHLSKKLTIKSDGWDHFKGFIYISPRFVYLIDGRHIVLSLGDPRNGTNSKIIIIQELL